MGLGMKTDIQGDKDLFRDKFKINDPFFLYVGRKDAGKKVDMLINYFCNYKRRNNNNLKLVLLGGGSVCIPEEINDQIIDLGFVDMQDKYNAYSASEFLCQPSYHESFSYVVMESWLFKKPVLVSEFCNVTTSFVKKTNAGLFFRDYFEFEGAINYFLRHKNIADEMGERGREYVINNYDWQNMIKKYTLFFDEIIEEQGENYG